MPTYQYACTACDQRLEAVQSFTDAPLTQCPACGGALRKVFSAVGVVFKGSGFYKTDSRGSKSADAGSDTKTETTTAGAKTESKTAAGSGGSGSGGKDSASSSSGSSAPPAASTPASKSA